jgi:hypothetical protein
MSAACQAQLTTLGHLDFLTVRPLDPGLTAAWAEILDTQRINLTDSITGTFLCLFVSL